MYSNPVILNSVTHKDFKLASVSRYDFAKQLNSCVVLGQEFIETAKYYPILFSKTKEGETISVAMLGISDNIFVSEDGAWQAGAYLPAFIRRYPYVLAEGVAEESRLTVCIDGDYEGFGAEEGEVLFTDDGTNSATLDKSIDFLRHYHEQFTITNAFVHHLNELEIVKPVDANISLAKGGNFTIRDLSMVDEEALHNLSDSQLAELVRRGYMPWIYAHLYSLANFNTIINRAENVVSQKED